MTVILLLLSTTYLAIATSMWILPIPIVTMLSTSKM